MKSNVIIMQKRRRKRPESYTAWLARQARRYDPVGVAARNMLANRLAFEEWTRTVEPARKAKGKLIRWPERKAS